MENVEYFREGEAVDIQSTSGKSVPQLAPPMEEFERALRDYALPSIGIPPVSRQPTIQKNNFEIIILQLIKNIQFMGLPNEDPNTHVSNFLEVCDTMKYKGFSDDAMHLRIFTFSLKDKAKHWLNSEPPEFITTWDVLVHKFLSKFLLSAKAAKMRIEIHNFAQYEGETFYEAWD